MEKITSLLQNTPIKCKIEPNSCKYGYPPDHKIVNRKNINSLLRVCVRLTERRKACKVFYY